MWRRVSFKDYSFRDKVCISALMGCIALCGVVAGDGYIKKDIKGICAGAVGVGITTWATAKYSHKSKKRARRRMYRERDLD